MLMMNQGYVMRIPSSLDYWNNTIGTLLKRPADILLDCFWTVGDRALRIANFGCFHLMLDVLNVRVGYDDAKL